MEKLEGNDEDYEPKSDENGKLKDTPRITNIEDGTKHLIYDEDIPDNEVGTINSKIKTIESEITTIFSGDYDYVEESDDSKTKTSKKLFDKIKEMSDDIKTIKGQIIDIDTRVGQLEAKAII